MVFADAALNSLNKKKPKAATRGRWVAVLVFTIGDERALIYRCAGVL